MIIVAFSYINILMLHITVQWVFWFEIQIDFKPSTQSERQLFANMDSGTWLPGLEFTLYHLQLYRLDQVYFTSVLLSVKLGMMTVPAQLLLCGLM